MPRRDRTLPMSKTLRCQTHQQYTTLLHQDAWLEEDAANGASVHNLPQVNASVLPATSVEYDSITMKHVSNSEAIVKPTITTCMHIVSTGGLGHDHELLPKEATDQDAVDAVTRQRGYHHQNSGRHRSTSAFRSGSVRIKPQQPRQLMMSKTCLDAKRLSAWTKRS